jgi:hypothetical protein
MRIAVWLVALAGCDDLFNLDHIDHKPHDAALVDAAADATSDAAFDRERDCPVNYDLALFAGSLYRITADSPFAWDAHDECNADKPGFTHLAAAQTQQELSALHASLVAKNLGIWRLGAVQPVAVTMPIEGWLWVTGEPVDMVMWTALEPNDGNGLEDDHSEQFAIISAQAEDRMIDLAGNLGHRAVCECDGRGVSPDAQTAVDQARM